MTNAEPPGQRSRRGTAALILAGASLVLSLIACYLAGSGEPGGTGDTDRLPVQSEAEVASASQLEAVAHVTLPPGTVLLSAAYSNGLETRLSAKFRMPRSELTAFVTATHFTAPLTPGLRVVGQAQNVGGGNLWDPDSATTVSGIDDPAATSAGTSREVLFDLDTANAVTVYLYAGRG